MKKTIFMFFILLLLLIPTKQASSMPIQVASEQNYFDADFGFSLSYPAGWTEEVLINDLDRRDGVIIKRTEFKSPSGVDGFLVDVFPTDPETSLVSWYSLHEKQFSGKDNIFDLSSRIDGDYSIFTYNPTDRFPRYTFLIKHDNLILRFDYEMRNVNLLKSFTDSIFSIEFMHPKGKNLNRISDFLVSYELNLEFEPQDQSCCGYSDPNPNQYACGRTGNCVWWTKYKRPDTGGSATNSWGNGTNWGPRARQEGFPVNNTPAAGTVACWAPLGQNHVSYVESYNPSTLIAAMSDMDWESQTHGCIAEYWNQKSNLTSLEFIYQKPVVVIPAAPTGLAASDGSYTDRVQVNWNGVSGATSYQVFRATSSGGTQSHIGTVSSGAYTDTAVTPGTTYWYWVKACNSAGCSGYSAGDSGYASVPVPSIPGGVQASDGTYTSHVHISWTSVSYATSYQVFRAESSTGTKTQIGTPTGPEYSDMSAAQGVTYWYWVKACNSSGCSNFSSGDSGYARLPIPVAPTSVSATDGLYTDRIQISWGLADKATNYQVFRAESATGGKTQIGDSTTQVFWDMDVEQGTTYWYWLKACNASGCSDFSPYDTGYALLPIPSTPNGLTATDGTYTDRVQVTWLNAPVASSYMLYRAESVSGTKSLVASLPINSYDDLDVIQGVSYWYWVKACNSSGCSDFSQSDIGYALLPIPSVPTNVSASDGLFSDYVKIDWSIVTTSSNYQIFRSDSISGTKTQLANITTNNYNDSNVVQGINYYYWIKACNSSGCSDYSQSDIGYALLPIPSAPTNVSASDGLFTDRIQITWQSTSGATNYQLYRSDTANGIKTQIANQASTIYNDLNVIQGNSYWYWVKACNQSGCSDFSQSDNGYALLPIPNPPSSISASDGTFTDRVQIDWSIAPGADNYQLFRSDTINGTKTQVATPASNSYVDYSIQQGTVYWYWIKACNGSGCSGFSVADSGYALIPIPSIPVGLTATDGTFSDRVQLSWQENSGAEAFNIYRSTNVNGTRSLIGTSQSNSYSDTNAVINVTYWYWIKACNQTGCSDFSASDSGFAAYQIPDAPVSVEASDGTYPDKVDVSWSTVPTATSYNVYRASSEQGNRGLIASVTSETYSDETAIVNQTYWYWIKACNSSGCSEYSESDSGYAAYPIPSIPQNVQASDGIYRDYISVTWDQVSDTSQYQLYRAESEISNPEMIAELATTQFQDYNATKGKVYWYWIKACNTTGCSNLSVGESGFTLLDSPSTPSNLKASDGTYPDKIALTWNNASNADSYEVYRAVSAFGVKQMIGTSTNNSFQDYSIDSNTLYWYWVKACNLSGTSQFSNSDSGYSSSRAHKNFLPFVIVK